MTLPSLSTGMPNRARLILLSIGAFSLIFFWLFFTANWVRGTDRAWATGGLKDGDLAQHYAAGLLWSEGKYETLYRHHQLGEWINHFREHLDAKKKLARFNYVYSPMVAQISSLFVGLSFETWLKGSLVLSLIAYLFSIWMIFFRLLPKFNQLGVPLLLALGFPSLFYTLVPSQNTALSLCFFCAASFFANQNKFPQKFLAGLLISCAFYKPQFMPYLAFFIFVAGEWKIAAGILFGTLFWLLLGIWICGVETHRLWFESLGAMMRGDQFVLQGLNQSWTGFFFSFFPKWRREYVGFVSNFLALVLMLGGANLIRFAPKTISWKPCYTIFAALTCYLLCSSYVGHYEVLLGLPWWLACIRHSSWKMRHTLLILLFWMISLCSIVGILANVSISAPFLTLWFFASLANFIDWQGVSDFCYQSKIKTSVA
jgi:hypothetical protein